MTMNADLVLGTLGVLGTGNILLFAQFLISRHDAKEEALKKENDKNSPVNLAVRALCEDRLATLLKEWLHADVRPATEWKTITALYKGYKALDGNDGIDKLYQDASELATTE